MTTVTEAKTRPRIRVQELVNRYAALGVTEYWRFDPTGQLFSPPKTPARKPRPALAPWKSDSGNKACRPDQA